MERSRTAVNIVFFVNGFTYANWAARIPRIQESFGLDHRSLGFILLAASIGALVAMPFTGWAIIKQGSKRITVISALLFVFSVPLFSLSPNAAVLAAAFFLMGLCTGTMDVAMNAQAVLVEQALKKPIMSFFHALFSLGMMAGAASGALFTRLDWSLFSHFSVICLVGLLLLILSFAYLVTDEPEKEEKHGPSFRLPDPALIGIGLIAFCCMLGEGAMADWSTVYMERIVNAAKTIAPLGLLSFSMAMTLGRFLGDSARSRFGDRKLLIGESILTCLGILTIVLWPTTAVAIAGFFLVGLGMATIVPIAYSQAGSMPGIPPGVGISMVTTIGYSGFLFGPPIIGYLADIYGLHQAFYLIAGLFALMLILSLRQKHA